MFVKKSTPKTDTTAEVAKTLSRCIKCGTIIDVGMTKTGSSGGGECICSGCRRTPETKPDFAAPIIPG